RATQQDLFHWPRLSTPRVRRTLTKAVFPAAVFGQHIHRKMPDGTFAFCRTKRPVGVFSADTQSARPRMRRLGFLAAYAAALCALMTPVAAETRDERNACFDDAFASAGATFPTAPLCITASGTIASGCRRTAATS